MDDIGGAGDGVVNRRRAPVLDLVQPASELLEVAGEFAQADQSRVEAQKRDVVAVVVQLRQQQLAHATADSGEVPHASASVNQQRHADRTVLVRLELEDGPLLPVVQHRELVLRERGNESALLSRTTAEIVTTSTLARKRGCSS